MPKTHVAERLGDVTDWSGRVLRKEILEFIGIDCINSTSVYHKCGEKFRRSSVPQSDKGQGWYNMGNSGRKIQYMLKTEDGKTFSVMWNEISEVPIDWQPKWFQRKDDDDKGRHNSDRGTKCTLHEQFQKRVTDIMYRWGGK